MCVVQFRHCVEHLKVRIYINYMRVYAYLVKIWWVYRMFMS